jgi:hypothetical protein
MTSLVLTPVKSANIISSVDLYSSLGQIESAKIIWDLLDGSKFALTSEEEVTIEEDSGVLRQDRYPLRTAPQFIGPQIEDLLTSLVTITRECNSSRCHPQSESHYIYFSVYQLPTILWLTARRARSTTAEISRLWQ